MIDGPYNVLCAQVLWPTADQDTEGSELDGGLQVSDGGGESTTEQHQ